MVKESSLFISIIFNTLLSKKIYIVTKELFMRQKTIETLFPD